MKNLLSLVLLAGVIFSGCSKKSDVEIDGQQGVDIKSEKAVSADDKLNQIAEINEVEVKEVVMTEEETKAKIISAAESKLGAVYFDFDKFNIREDMVSTVDANVNVVTSEENKSLKIKVEGNCDEWGTDEYNYALGLKRAKTVKDALIAQSVEADNIILISYGESNPVCEDHTKDCWAKNRRVDFKLLP